MVRAQTFNSNKPISLPILLLLDIERRTYPYGPMMMMMTMMILLFDDALVHTTYPICDTQIPMNSDSAVNAVNVCTSATAASWCCRWCLFGPTNIHPLMIACLNGANVLNA